MENKDYLKSFKIIIDSSVDLTKEIIEEEDIDVMHFTVTIDEKPYRDGIDITVDELFEIANRTGKLPKTSAFGPAMYEEEINKFLDYPDIIFIGLGSGFSSSLNSARIGTEDYTNVHIIDSQNLSSGTGLLVLKICKMRKEGKTVSEILKEVDRLIPLVRSQFAINTLQYLYMGGRCSGMTKIFGTVLKIKPIIKVVDNAMVVAKKPIGFSKAIEAMLEECIKLKDNIDLDCIMITHSKADEDAKYIKEQLSKYFDPSILLETYASGTISTHCGPRTIGILYIVKE